MDELQKTKSKPFGVRLREDLKEEARKLAKDRRWSLNSFIEYSVEEQIKREQEQAA